MQLNKKSKPFLNKSFVEAHSIQQKVKRLYAQELGAWMESRENKIQITLKNMRNKQDA